MFISIILDQNVTNDKVGNLSLVNNVVKVKDLEFFAKVCLKYHICCGTFFNNKRKLEDFKEIWFLQYDFDNGTNVDTVIEKLSGYNFVIMASKNHLKEKNDGKGIIPRFHVFIPLQTPITDEEYYKHIIKKYAKKWNFNIDKQSIDATRYFYKHSAFLYGCKTKFNFDANTGQNKLEWASEKQKEAKENEDVMNFLEEQNKINNITYSERIKAAKIMISEKVGESISGNGGDKNTFIALCYAVRCGLNDSGIKEVADWYNLSYCTPKWNQRELLHKIKYAKKLVKMSSFLSPQYLMKIIKNKGF